MSKVLSPTVIFLLSVCFCNLFLIGTRAQAQDSFSIVLLPDTQYYSRYNPSIYQAQTQWIVDHRESSNIKFVIHLGDITHKNSDLEWASASEAHEILDNADIPYSMVPGNHDNPDSGRKRDTHRYNLFFGPWRFEGESWYGGHLGSTNDSNFAYFDHDNLQFMILSLEFAPRKDVLDWAHEIVSAHPSHRVIIVTHCYQRSCAVDACSNIDGQCGNHAMNCACKYRITGSNGRALWNEFVKRHSNIFMVLSGHITDSEHRIRTGLAENQVHEILSDYQGELKGGNGWLKLVTFYPEDNRVDVEAITVLNSVNEFEEDVYSSNPHHSDHTFSLNYDMVTPVSYSFSSPIKGFSDRTVNSVASGHQGRPAVAMNQNGDSVVVWEDDKDRNGYYQVYARGFDAHGFERFHDITVNAVASGQQLRPAVEIDENGNFVVVWQDDKDKNGYYNIRARGFYPDGTVRFSDRLVNADTDGQQLLPDIAMHSSGYFVVVWQDDKDNNGFYNIRVRGFDEFGDVRFSDRRVNSDTQGQQENPTVAMDGNGCFVVAWQDDKDENGWWNILARGFNLLGGELIDDFRVNQVADGQQLYPDISMDQYGNFVIVWQDDKDINGWWNILTRGFDQFGSERIGDFRAHEDPQGHQRRPAVAMDKSTGEFVITWRDDRDKNGWYNIRASAFENLGDPLFWDRRVNYCTEGEQYRPAVAIGGPMVPLFLTVWEDDMNNNGKGQILLRGLKYSVQPCYHLTLTSSGSGCVPAASPSSSSGCSAGQYHAGEAIQLTVSPASGWEVASWGGTDDDASTATTNTLTMPVSSHTARVIYGQPCYRLTLTQTGSGSAPAATPSSSSGCPLGWYHGGWLIRLDARPASGWLVGSWNGTHDDASTSTVNWLWMPAGNHSAGVNYNE